MKLIYHPKQSTFKNLFKKYGLNPSDETALFLLPGVSVVQEMEDYYCGEGVWGKNLLTFNELSDFVNEVSPNLKRKRISRAQLLSVTRKAAELVSENLEVFGEFTRNRDFLNAAAVIISKLKQSGVSAGELIRSAGRTGAPNLRKKLSDIGLVYEKYEALITERGFLDDADSVCVVSKELNREGLARFFPTAKRLVIFGFSDFTHSELGVIKSLSSSVSETFFFVGDFGGLGEYRDCFLARFREASVVYEEDRAMIGRPPASGTQTEYREFYDSHEEIEHVSRTIKKLVLDKGRKPSDFKVLVRSAQNRGRSIATIFEKNGVAVNLRNSATLAESVYGHLACDILRLKSGGFQRDDLIRLLKSPLFVFYMGISDHARLCVNLVKTLSSANTKHTTIRGIPGWRRILEHITRTDERLSSCAGAIGLALDSVSSKFGRKSFAAMTSDLRKILSELRVSESSALLIERNATTRECFDEFFSFLRELSFSCGEFDFRVSGPGDYLLLLEDFMRERTVLYKTPHTVESERVTVTDFSSARGTNPEFLFLTGLSDSSFPSSQPMDPVLKSREKTEINRALGKRVFDGEGLHYEKEKHLFLTLGAAVSGKAFFSCYRYDQRSREVNRSDFIEETMDVSSVARPGSVSVPESPFSREDILSFCLLSSENPGADGKIAGILARRYGTDILNHLSAGVYAERKRLESSADYTEFEGVLLDPPPQADYFSPTQLEDYGTCPFMYFSKRILRLSKPEDPDQQKVSRLALGSLAHSILSEFMESLFAPADGKRPDSVRALYEELRRKYEDSTRIFSHLPENVAYTEKKRFFEHVLWNFVSDEVRRIEDNIYTPSFFEKEVEFRIEGSRIRGKIDRVDVHESPEAAPLASVVDYKIGSLQGKKYFDFKNLQLPLYLKALLEEGMKPVDGRYLSIEKSGDAVSSKSKGLSLEGALLTAESHIKNIEKGFFPPYVGKKPPEGPEYLQEMSRYPCYYCDYADLCRVKNGVRRKRQSSEGADDV